MVTSCKVASCKVTSCKVASCKVASCKVASCTGIVDTVCRGAPNCFHLISGNQIVMVPKKSVFLCRFQKYKHALVTKSTYKSNLEIPGFKKRIF
jgi:hypothetical protein